MKEYERLGAKAPSVATKAELLQRLRERKGPESVQAPTPPIGSEHLLSEMRTENEKRIGELRKTLGSAHRNLETQHSFARLSGHAKSKFEQQR